MVSLIMNNRKSEEHDSAAVDLNSVRIRKKVLEETDPDCREAVEDFLDKFKSDTLTGL